MRSIMPILKFNMSLALGHTLELECQLCVIIYFTSLVKDSYQNMEVSHQNAMNHFEDNHQFSPIQQVLFSKQYDLGSCQYKFVSYIYTLSQMMTYQRGYNNPSSNSLILLPTIFSNAIESTEKILHNNGISLNFLIHMNFQF